MALCTIINTCHFQGLKSIKLLRSAMTLSIYKDGKTCLETGMPKELALPQSWSLSRGNIFSAYDNGSNIEMVEM